MCKFSTCSATIGPVYWCWYRSSPVQAAVLECTGPNPVRITKQQWRENLKSSSAVLVALSTKAFSNKSFLVHLKVLFAWIFSKILQKLNYSIHYSMFMVIFRTVLIKNYLCDIWFFSPSIFFFSPSNLM